MYQFTDYATIHFNPKTEEYALTDAIGYEEPYESGFDQELGISSGGISFDDAYSEPLNITDNEVTAKVDSDIYVEVTRIKGTIAYLQ